MTTAAAPSPAPASRAPRGRRRGPPGIAKQSCRLPIEDRGVLDLGPVVAELWWMPALRWGHLPASPGRAWMARGIGPFVLAMRLHRPGCGPPAARAPWGDVPVHGYLPVEDASQFVYRLRRSGRVATLDVRWMTGERWETLRGGLGPGWRAHPIGPFVAALRALA
jgi:hypothetical protein